MAKSKLKIDAKGNGSYYDSYLKDTVYFQTELGAVLYGFNENNQHSGQTIQVHTSDSIGYRDSYIGNTEWKLWNGITKRETPLSIKELVLDLLNFTFNK